MKAIAVFIIALATHSCVRLPEYSLPDHEIFRYSKGDILVYKNQHNESYNLIIDDVYREYVDNTSTTYPSHREELQRVYQHFQHEEKLIEKSDSLYQITAECRRVNSYDYCDSLYSPGSFNMKITLATESYERSYKYLIWKKYLWLHIDDDFQDIGDFELNGLIYENVYKIDFSESAYDSITPYKYIYFNYRDGILKFEDKDSEVVVFYKKQ